MIADGEHPVVDEPNAIAWNENAPTKGGGYVYGSQAVDCSAVLDVTRPVQNGRIADWEQMERVWRNSWEGGHLQIDPAEVFASAVGRITEWGPQPADITVSSQMDGWLLLDRPLTLDDFKEERQRSMSTAFESFGFPSFLTMSQASSVTLATGRQTALVLDLSTFCSVTPVYETCFCPPKHSDIGGDYILEQFHRALHQSRDMTGIEPRHLKKARKWETLTSTQRPQLSP